MTIFGVWRHFLILSLILTGCGNSTHKGTESSGGGGGGTEKVKPEIVQATIEKHFKFLKSPDGRVTASYFIAPYRLIFDERVKSAVNENPDRSSFLTPEGLSQKSKYLFDFFKAGFTINENDSKSTYFYAFFVLNFDNERLLEVLNSSDVIFEKCAERRDLDKSKLAYYFKDAGKSRGEFCFDIKGLSNLDTLNLDVQISALIIHELAHAFGLDEAAAESIQQSYYNIFVDFEKSKLSIKKTFELMSDILEHNSSICSDGWNVTDYRHSVETLFKLIEDREPSPVTLVDQSSGESVIQEFLAVKNRNIGDMSIFTDKSSSLMSEDQIKEKLCTMNVNTKQNLAQKTNAMIIKALKEYSEL